MSQEMRKLIEDFKSVNNILTENDQVLIYESKLSRLWQHIQDRKPFGMISLSRSTMDRNERINAFITLKDKVREMGYGFIELKGGYVEKDAEGNPIKDVADELSLMVPNISKEDLIELGMIDLGHGPQDTVLYCDGDNFLGYIITNPNIGNVGDVDMEFDYGKDKDALPMGKKAVSQYFSMLKKGAHSGRKFSFKGKQMENFEIYEMRDRRYPKNPNGDWWDNFGIRIY